MQEIPSQRLWPGPSQKPEEPKERLQAQTSALLFPWITGPPLFDMQCLHGTTFNIMLTPWDHNFLQFHLYCSVGVLFVLFIWAFFEVLFWCGFVCVFFNIFYFLTLRFPKSFWYLVKWDCLTDKWIPGTSKTWKQNGICISMHSPWKMRCQNPTEIVCCRLPMVLVQLMYQQRPQKERHIQQKANTESLLFWRLQGSFSGYVRL